jgi:integrase
VLHHEPKARHSRPSCFSTKTYWGTRLETCARSAQSDPFTSEYLHRGIKCASFGKAIEDTPGTPARLLVDLLYGCGLRVSEPVELRVKDVLWDEGPHGQLVIRGAKGGKDRRVPIPSACVAPLRVQMDHARSKWSYDRLNSPGVGVTLPNRVAVKYPDRTVHVAVVLALPFRKSLRPTREAAIGFAIIMLSECIQRAVHKAARKIGLGGVITPHVLRHAYATHSRESLDSLRTGCSGIRPSRRRPAILHSVVDRASNPLDDLLK